MFITNDTLVPKDIASRFEIKYNRAEYKFYWPSNSKVENPYFHWHHEICGGDAHNILDLTSEFLPYEHDDEALIWELLQKEILGPRKLVRCYVNGYTFGTEGYPHTDSKRESDRTAIVYLNQWKNHWAGETVVWDTEKKYIEATCLPALGRVFVFPSNRLHAGRSVSRIYRGLRSVLIYKTSVWENDSTDVMTYKNYLREKTEGMKHGSQTFYQHLVLTYDLLREMNAPYHVQLAGLFHSIYGTSFYNPNLVATQEEIRNMIGSQAEQLVWLFCNIDRKKHDLELNDANHLQLRSGVFIHITAEQISELALLAKANRNAHA